MLYQIGFHILFLLQSVRSFIHMLFMMSFTETQNKNMKDQARITEIIFLMIACKKRLKYSNWRKEKVYHIRGL